MKGRPLSPAQQDELKRQWAKSLDELATMFGVCRETIWKTGKRLALPPRKRGREPGCVNLGRPPAIDGAKLARLKREWHHPLRFLVARYGTSRETLIDTGIRNGFPARKDIRRPRGMTEELSGLLTFRCHICCAQFQGSACPQGHAREQIGTVLREFGQRAPTL